MGRIKVRIDGRGEMELAFSLFFMQNRKNEMVLKEYFHDPK